MKHKVAKKAEATTTSPTAASAAVAVAVITTAGAVPTTAADAIEEIHRRRGSLKRPASTMEKIDKPPNRSDERHEAAEGPKPKDETGECAPTTANEGRATKADANKGEPSADTGRSCRKRDQSQKHAEAKAVRGLPNKGRWKIKKKKKNTSRGRKQCDDKEDGVQLQHDLIKWHS